MTRVSPGCSRSRVARSFGRSPRVLAVSVTTSRQCAAARASSCVWWSWPRVDTRRYHQWSAANLVNEVQRIRERQAVIDTANKNLAAEGTPVIADPIKQFGNDYYQRRLTGAKAIAAARKAGELAAGVDSSSPKRSPPLRLDEALTGRARTARPGPPQAVPPPGRGNSSPWTACR